MTDDLPQKGRSAPLLVSKPEFFTKLNPAAQEKIQNFAQQSIRYHGDKTQEKKNENVIMDLKTKINLSEERARAVLHWVESENSTENRKSLLESGEPEWFAAMYPDQKKVVLQNLSDGLNTYGALNESLYKYMEECCGILPNQTEEAYHYLLSQKHDPRPSTPTISENGVTPTHDRNISLSTDDKIMLSNDILETYISDLRIWRDPLFSGSWFLFGLLIWFLLVVGETPVVSLFALGWIFFITICATFVNTFSFWIKFVSTDVPRIGDNTPSKEPFQVPEEFLLEITKWALTCVNDWIQSIMYICSCRSNIDTLKVLFKLSVAGTIAQYVSGTTICFSLYCNFFLGNLFWSNPSIVVWYDTCRRKYEQRELRFRQWCQEKRYELDIVEKKDR